MRVISQDGTIDVPYENFVFSILNSSGGNYGIVAVKNVAEPPEVFWNSLIATYSTEANAIKTTMWKFLMDKGQKENIPALKEYIFDLIKMTTQKTAGQRKEVKDNISWDELDMTLMSIVIEATALVLSGRLDELKD